MFKQEQEKSACKAKYAYFFRGGAYLLAREVNSYPAFALDRKRDYIGLFSKKYRSGQTFLYAVDLYEDDLMVASTHPTCEEIISLSFDWCEAIVEQGIAHQLFSTSRKLEEKAPEQSMNLLYN